MSDALAKNSKLREVAEEEKEAEESAAQDLDVTAPDGEGPKKAGQADGKLIVEEEIAEGHVSWQSGSSILFI